MAGCDGSPAMKCWSDSDLGKKKTQINSSHLEDMTRDILNIHDSTRFEI